jgi:hypothetical protein
MAGGLRTDFSLELFSINIQEFSSQPGKTEVVLVGTIWMHGSPRSRWDSKDLWKPYDYRKLGILGEPLSGSRFRPAFLTHGYGAEVGRVEGEREGQGQRSKVGGGRKTEGVIHMSRIVGFITMLVLPRLTNLPIRHSGTGFSLLGGSEIAMGPISVLYKLPFDPTLSERI